MASTTKSARDVVLAPVWTEKSAAQMEDNHLHVPRRVGRAQDPGPPGPWRRSGVFG
jgi:hypothetical protein